MEIRWASVPTNAAQPELRGELLHWFPGSRDPVTGFIQRQATADVLAWIEARAKAYAATFSDEKPLRLWYEAAADLIAWQRRRPASGILGWLRAWDEVAAEVMEVRR